MNQIIEYNDSEKNIGKNIKKSFDPMILSMEYKSLYLNTNINKTNTNSKFKKTIYSEKFKKLLEI